jgi:Bacterial regulatory proteins, gntR family
MSVQDAIEIEGDPTAVYRLYDADGTLLYIGITRNIALRFAHHEIYKPWWPQVVRKTMTWYGSRAEAIRAESAAIVSEGPLYNIAGAPREEDPPERVGSWRDRPLTMKEAETMLAMPGRCAADLPSPPRPARQATGDRRYVMQKPSAVYAYVKLANHLEAEIRSGNIAPEVRLSAEQVMRREYGVSLGTIRKALALLRDKGLIVTLSALGTFVVRELPPQE